jgi:hypothetical protein
LIPRHTVVQTPYVRFPGGRVWLVTAAIACGDNQIPIGEPLVHARDLAIMAHSDDDLVYLQPDQLERTQRGGATIVYVSDGRADADRRHGGVMLAYSAATGFERWQCGWIELAGHAAEHCRLEDAHLSLVFLGYPEGEPDGSNSASIGRLWDGTLDVAISVGDITASYTRDDVIAVLAEIVELTQPQTVRTLDLAGVHGIDHVDHAIAGAAALLAVAASTLDPLPDLIAFRADGTAADPATLIDPLFDRSAGVLAYYDGCVERTVPCGQPAAAITESHAMALRRRYAASLRLARGQLQLGGGAGCIGANAEGGLEIVACPASEEWSMHPDGTMRLGERCLEALTFNGELNVTSRCEPTANHRFFLDDEGHLWLGAALEPRAGGALYCVTQVGSQPLAAPCGPEHAPIWQLTPTPTAQARPAGLPSGRAVRLADLDGDRQADLCGVTGGKLRCAAGDGAGGFGALVDTATLAIEPESLVVGDVDGDGSADACGRDQAGLLCALAPSFTVLRWSPAFARSGPADASDRSLAAIDSDNDGTAEICGVSFAGVICAERGLVDLPPVRSPWPDRDAPFWPLELDGDRRADWCSRTASGVSCGLELLSTVTTDGVPWTYSQQGIRDPIPDDMTTSAAGDVDADGRSDLCGIYDRGTGPQIACARSQGFGFGPLAVFATLPEGAAYTGLWLGDLDGDRFADACADDGTTIYCARSR